MKNLILSIPTPSSLSIPRVRVSNHTLAAILLGLVPAVAFSYWFLIPLALIACLLTLRIVRDITAMDFEINIDDPMTREIHEDLWG